MKNNNENNLPATYQTVSNFLNKNEKYIKAALPRHLDIRRMIQVVLTSIARNPSLLNCEIKSLLGAVIESAQIGLYPDSVLGHAALVPFKNRVQLIIMYKGFIELARRSDQAIVHVPHVVYSEDAFDYRYGTNGYLHHKPAKGSRGERIGAYAKADIFAGNHVREVFEFIPADEIEELRDSILSTKRNPNESPWVTAEDEMWRKTPLRRLAKFIPQCPELQRAAVLDEMYESGVDQALVFDPSVGDVEAKTQEKQRQLTERLANVQKGLTQESIKEGTHGKPAASAGGNEKPPTDPKEKEDKAIWDPFWRAIRKMGYTEQDCKSMKKYLDEKAAKDGVKSKDLVIDYIEAEGRKRFIEEWDEWRTGQEDLPF